MITNRAARIAAVLVAVAAPAVLVGCTYERHHGITAHYADWNAREPRRNFVTVCSAYGCRKQTKVKFGKGQLDKITKLMRKTKRKDTPAEERRAIAYAIGHMERYVGGIVGTSADRPGMDFRASGDPTQQDCVDEATNTTSYLLLLEKNGLLKHHTVGTPFSKGNILAGVEYWPHWTAVLHDTENGNQRFAVDSWIYANGENPAIVEAEKWYIEDLNNLPKSTT
ncbi:MAG: hypothetical protein AAGF32_00980 [Pseudomonadota bacterium]